ncbi:hypothetical protein EN788_34320 [Mesorhizobium sp. M2D.F.Ca.ET.145.01.1.1]|nr:hypothetical protein EN788_34320 [Mesorhizobium sp. M2D.F.Ca.ET.145.01.1.1]
MRGASPEFVIHGRSKERSDAAQTRGSMPRLPGAAAVQNRAPLHLPPRSRHGSSGLRDAATRLLRPWMTTGLMFPPIVRACGS